MNGQSCGRQPRAFEEACKYSNTCYLASPHPIVRFLDEPPGEKSKLTFAD